MSSILPRPPVLVVETNYLLASAIEFPLTTAGYQVLVATNSDEALAILDNQEVAIALIDFRLAHGGRDGLVAIMASRAIPYVFCTASTLEEVHEHFPGARVILKPFGDDQLLGAVARLPEAGGSLDAQP